MSEEQLLKKQLIEKLGSKDGGVTSAAMYELGKRGWDTDGTLRNANLKGADLYEAILVLADLAGADLSEACLYAAGLQKTNLQGAVLVGADLKYAFLNEANLRGANLEGAEFDVNTTLPDGTRWTPDTDLKRFTDPNHPNFWSFGTEMTRNEQDDK